MKWFETGLKICQATSRLAIWLGGACILAISALIGGEVLLRKFLNLSTGGADELSGYALAISFSWGLSFTALKRAHIRIDALHSRLSSGFRAYLDCLSIISLTFFAIILAYFCFQVLMDSIALDARSNTTLGIPLWIPQSLWITGLVLFAFTCLLLSTMSLWALVTGNQDRVTALVGSRTTNEEIISDSGVSASDLGAR